MEYFENNRLLSFEDLEQAVDKDGNRVYSERLIEKIKTGDFNALNEINLGDRNNKYFMEPLLYAVKNSQFATYEVYKYYGEELQKNDLTMATEVVINEPEVIENTVISDNETIMLYLVKINPEVILYMSGDLKSDGEFIEKVCETGGREAISYVAQECNLYEALKDNPDLANNKEFMKEAVKEDANMMGVISEDLKNDYDFLIEACTENKEVINYVAEHTDEFGKEGLNAAKEVVLVENITCRAIEDWKSDLEKIQEEKAAMEAQENFDAKSEEYKEIKIKQRQLSNNINFFEKLKNGEIPQERAVRLINTVCENMDEDYRKEFLQYIKMDDAVLEKSKENSKNTPEITMEKTLEGKIIPLQIEEKTEDARISEINKETQTIRKEYLRETQEKEVENNDKQTGSRI